MASNDLPENQPPVMHTHGSNAGKRKRKQSLSDLNYYQKKQILNYLKQHGCHKEGFTKALYTFKNKELICDKLTKYIEDAEDNVHEECESFCFNNINEWLHLLKEIKLHEHCYYEAAVVINAIACNEPQPTLEELGGIDLKEVYKFLGKALLGQPQEQLSIASAQFLSKEFELLIDEANSSAGDQAAETLKQELKVNTKNPEVYNFSALPQHNCSMDPFGLYHKME